MSKSFAFVMFLMGILIAQAACAATPAPNNPDSDEDVTETETDNGANLPAINPNQAAELAPKEKNDKVEEEDDDDEDDIDLNDSDEETSEGKVEGSTLPLLTCALFENENACNAMCSMVGAIYGDPITSGTCGDWNDCECDVSENASLEDFWKAKFNSDAILQNIRKNKDLSKKVLSVLRTPLQTLPQTIQGLKEHLPQKLLKRLRPKDNTAQNLIAEDGTFDQLAVEKYVAEKLKSSDKLTSPDDFKKTLLNVLNTTEEDERNHIVHEIRYTRNKALNSVLDEYFNKRSIKEPALPSEHQESLTQMLDKTIVNRLIKSPPRKNPNHAKVSLGASASRSKSTVRKSTNANTSLKKSTTNLKTTQVDQDAPWNLPGFDKNEALKLQSGRKCWYSSDYHVCLNKSSTKTKLHWNNLQKNSRVEIEICNTGGTVKQDWTYNGNHVELKNFPSQNSYSGELWELGKSKLETYKYMDGTVERSWTGAENPDALRDFQRFIDTWCDNNDYFVGKENCSIYVD